VAKCHSQ